MLICSSDGLILLGIFIIQQRNLRFKETRNILLTKQYLCTEFAPSLSQVSPKSLPSFSQVALHSLVFLSVLTILLPYSDEIQ